MKNKDPILAAQEEALQELERSGGADMAAAVRRSMERTNMTVKIITACSQGLCRSVGLADVLKLHFEPVDVIPIGLNSNSEETIRMLANWCDFFIVMTENLKRRIPAGIEGIDQKVLVCDVGEDRYKNSKHRELIDQVWQWTRKNQARMGIQEHNRRI